MTHGLGRLEQALPKMSLERRIGVLVLVASTIVVGIVAAVTVPLELIPSGFSPPFLVVVVPWADAPPAEVVDKIVLPLEDELSTVRGLDTLNSFSASGFARIFMSFKSGTDMDVAYREVRDRIERARPRLPDDADRIFIRKEDESAIPVYVLGLAVDPDISDAYTLIQNEIVLPIQRLDGVANVEVNGILEKEIFIELDRERTEGAGLNIYQLAQELGDDNFTLASGDVRAGDRKLLLRSVARYGSLEELENRMVAPRVRLKDVGTVRYASPEARFRVRANSRPAVALVVLKEGQANTLEVARAVRTEVERMEDNPRLQTIGMVPLFDQGRVIVESLDTLLASGRIGGIFALIVLFFFLRRLRLTLIITLAIPLSLLIALTAMFFAGESLNILSLLGLMISVGLLVDNSVVVAENIHRLHREGFSRRDAAIRGAGEIALAITMATLTTIIVFLPVSLVEGQAQFFLLRLSLPISVALLGSLAVAGIVIPLATYLTLRDGQPSANPVAVGYRRFRLLLEHAYEASFGRLNRGYSRLLAVFLRRRADLILLILLVTAATGALVASGRVRFVEVQEEERSGFEVEVRLPDATTLEEAEAFFLECEGIVEGAAEELDLSGWFIFHRERFGEVQGWFNNPRTNDLTPREVTEKVLEMLPERPGVRYYTGDEAQGEERGDQVHVVALYGEDADELERVAGDLEQLFASVPGVLGVKASADPAPSELALVIDRERAQQHQISPRVVAGMVGYALRGQQLSRYRAGGLDIPVRVRFVEEDRDSLAELTSFYVPAGERGFVPLGTVTDLRYLQQPRTIFRRDKRLTRTITLELEEGTESDARRRIAALQARLDLPEGVRIGAPPGRAGPDEDLAAIRFAILLSIVFIYLLMGFLFESFALPLSIIGTIPLAGLGVVWVHAAMGLNIDFLGAVGVVLLIGVVVNNGIVLIDYVNRLRLEGMARTDALLTAASRRFRPIMMTALTTICGMIPVTLSGANSIGLSYTSFGLTLIGGLTTATLLTLLVVPVLYTLIEDIRELVVGAARRARGPGPDPVSPTA
jgi:HAE1 family hydrophobic/amphiphilic exporter-1